MNDVALFFLSQHQHSICSIQLTFIYQPTCIYGAKGSFQLQYNTILLIEINTCQHVTVMNNTKFLHLCILQNLYCFKK